MSPANSQDMTDRRELFIPCGTILLEAVLESPGNLQDEAPAAVICHPHPLFGGNLHNNVTRSVKNGLLERGMICLRFNFRGTGGSEGKHGDGIGELEDVRAAIDFLDALAEADSKRLVVAGYSFGCWVSLRAAVRDPRPSRLIGISPPVESYDFSFLQGEIRPKLLMAGDNDFVCSTRGFHQLLDQIPEPKIGVILPGADHFHVGREKALINEIEAFFRHYPL